MERESTQKRSERSMVYWALGIFAFTVLAMLMLAVAAESPPHVRQFLEPFMHAVLGAVIAGLAFRALLAYPYRVTDLIAIVMVLSLSLKFLLDQTRALVQSGVAGGYAAPDDPQGLRLVVLVSMIEIAILLAGAALGLRYCARFSIDSPWWRIFYLVCSMFSLPALVGVPALFATIIVDAANLGTESKTPFGSMVLWCACAFITFVNARLMVRSLQLKG